MRKYRFELLGLLVCAFVFTCGTARAADPFAEGVRKSEPLPPEQEQKTLHVPEGFEVQLVAAEPDIHKPMNMAFDAKGRLWVTSTVEYPWPVKGGGPGRDTVKVLEDFGPDGKARKITTFAEGLNIPIGLYPFEGGLIVHSIPNVWIMKDTDGDGKADTKEILWGPIGFEKDTHGMTSAFRRGFDGWIYATHGFNNDTSFTCKDGSSVKMNSGNTYRVKVDGSRVEQYTWGQVNPFGLAFDPLGNLYSADCHSSPIYQLLRGAYYPSFGKPHDGLGFGPDMMKHSHGSTAIGGIVFYADDKFPAEFQNNCFIGNVMTSRINRDNLEDHGSTRIAKQATDFLKADDPWFRPVDQQLGPDGCIYVADFYNRIIGHYEVPLTHPGRDRERGRIWRIVYKGGNAAEPKMPDISKSNTAQLIEALGSGNLTLRMLATSQLTDRIGKAAVPEVKAAIGKGNAWQKIHGMWVLHRLEGLDAEIIAANAKDESREVRTHAMKVLSESATITAEQRVILIAALQDKDAFVQRAAADALGRHPGADNIKPLMDQRAKVAADDTHLLYTVRMAIRNQLRGESGAKVLASLPQAGMSEVETQVLAEMALAVPSPESGSFLLRHMQKSTESRDKLSAYLKHAARYVPAGDIDALVTLIQTKFAGDDEFQIALFKPLQEGMTQRGAALSDAVKTWAGEMAGKMLAASEPGMSWMNTPLEGAATPDPWGVQKRDSADGNKGSPFISSLPNEKFTGTLRSKVFGVPAKLTFFAAGHNGPPDKNDPPKNFIRLREAETNTLLIETVPPRNDIAQKIDWDLAKFEGKKAYLELVDGDTAPGFAWLAVGRFTPAVVDMPKADANDLRLARLNGIETANSLKISKLEPQIAKFLGNSTLDTDTRVASAKALLSINPGGSMAALAAIVIDAKEGMTLREKLGQVLADANTPDARALLAGTLAVVPERLQVKLALSLAGNADGAEFLMKTIADGKASPRLLQDKKIRERLDAAKLPELEERIAKLTKGLQAPDAELQKLINKRRNEYDAAKASAAKGQALFQKTCAVCHKLENVGALVGPQLDGVGARGLERIVEDVLDPNRNVDPAFRTTVVILTDGRVITGLQRREEGETLVFADNTGKEVSVSKKEIKTRNESKFSLMPDNFGEVIPQADFNDLLSYLLSKTAK
jgi:putative heme-binding domain-containing protein